jgi:general secretion pathway protein G
MTEAGSPHAGFSLLELMIVTMLIGTLSAIAAPIYFEALNAARAVRARADIKNISTTIDVRHLTTGQYPDSLADVGLAELLDPWGRPYQYLKIEGLQGHGQVRKDKHLVPINSDYDLYSMGKDGESVTALTAKVSLDDIVRANNGGFIGLAADY